MTCAGVAVEDAAGLTEVQGEVVTLGVAVAVQGDREDRHTDQPDRVADLSSQRGASGGQRWHRPHDRGRVAQPDRSPNGRL